MINVRPARNIQRATVYIVNRGVCPMVKLWWESAPSYCCGQHHKHIAQEREGKRESTRGQASTVSMSHKSKTAREKARGERGREGKREGERTLQARRWARLVSTRTRTQLDAWSLSAWAWRASLRLEVLRGKNQLSCPSTSVKRESVQETWKFFVETSTTSRAIVHADESYLLGLILFLCICCFVLLLYGRYVYFFSGIFTFFWLLDIFSVYFYFLFSFFIFDTFSATTCFHKLQPSRYFQEGVIKDTEQMRHPYETSVNSTTSLWTWKTSLHPFSIIKPPAIHQENSQILRIT